MQANSNGKEVSRCVEVLLEPVARFCLRHSVRLQHLFEQFKIVFLNVAAEEMRKEGNKVSLSRLSVMTGVHRKDVARLYRDQEEKPKKADLISKIINRWEQDPRFTTARGKPRVLNTETEDSEFNDLVKSVSVDLTHYPVIRELERLKLVEKTPKGIRLLKGGYQPSDDLREGIQLMADDVTDLVISVEENIERKEGTPNYHIKTEYDNIAQDSADIVREWFFKQGVALHHRARKFLSSHDVDVNESFKKKGKEGGVRAVIGGYSRVELLALK